MTVTVTGTVVDVTGRKDSREWRAWSPVYREGTGGAVVTYREQDVQVVAGALTARLEPGPCFIQNPDGDRWLVTVPDTDTELWPLIAVAVAIPPGTPADELNAAVTAYFDANPVDVGPEGPPNVLEIGTVVSGPTAGATITGTSPTQTLNLTLPKGDKGDPGTPGTSGDWATLTNKPAVIAAGADAATARSVISAQASDSDLTAIAALSPANDDVVQRKSGAWTNRTPAQLKTDLALVKGDVGLGSVDNTADAAKNVATAAKLTTARQIAGQTFDGSADITATNLKTGLALTKIDVGLGNVDNTADATKSVSYAATAGSATTATTAGSTTGNAATATKLATARNIAGQSFDGTADISASALKSALSLSKVDVSLGNVDNTSDLTKARAVTNNQTGTTYTLALTDASKTVELNNASAITLTVPPNSSVAFTAGDMIELWQQGAGQVTVVAGSGVTIRSAGAKLKLTGQYSSAFLRYRGSDEWVLVGDLA